MNKIDLGAQSELAAAAHLMGLDYKVFRAMSPSSPFDLVAYKDGQCLRVEVKTAKINRPLGVRPAWSIPVHDEWDLLAIVFDGCTTLISKSEFMGAARRHVLDCAPPAQPPQWA